MNEVIAKRGVAPVAKPALFLLFRIGSERYALRATEVAEVLPRVALKPFAYRGAVVPVIDLSALTFGQPAEARTSTRLVLVNYRPDDAESAQWLGLILEQATDTLRCHPEDFQPYGLDNREAPYLGPVREDAQGLVQWVRVNDLLAKSVRALLFPDPPRDPAQLEVQA